MRRIFLLLGFLASMAFMVGCSASVDIDADLGSYDVSGYVQTSPDEPSFPPHALRAIKIFAEDEDNVIQGKIVYLDEYNKFTIKNLKKGSYCICAFYDIAPYNQYNQGDQFGEYEITLSKNNNPSPITINMKDYNDMDLKLAAKFKTHLNSLKSK